MPDVYSIITELPREVVERLAHAMETRAASPQMRKINEAFMSSVVFPQDARVLEIGCGSGPVAAMLVLLGYRATERETVQRSARNPRTCWITQSGFTMVR